MSEYSTTSDYRRVSLFSVQFVLFIVFLFASLGVLFWRMGHVTDRDVKEYNELVASAESSHSSSVHENPYTAYQERQNIKKDLFFYKNHERMQIHLIAAKSQLVLDHKEAHTSIVEQMQKVKCIMQEELFYLLPDGREALLQSNGQLLIRSADEKDPNVWLPTDSEGVKPMQIIRYIEADDAEYHYKEDRFVGYSVKISRYSTQGHHLKGEHSPKKVLMKGSADRVEFSLKNENHDLNFKAHRLKGTFFDMENVK